MGLLASLAQQPLLLLLDEPSQNLDIGRQVELLDLLHHLHDEGITIFASMHDLHLVHGNFSRIHLLNASHELSSGTPQEMLTPERLSHAFDCAAARQARCWRSAPSVERCTRIAVPW